MEQKLLPTENSENTSNESPLFSLTDKLQGDQDDKAKEQLQELYEKLSTFLKSQNLPESLKIDPKKLDPQNLKDFLKILNTELLSDYVHIRKLSPKQIMQIIMNYGCLYGRVIDENLKIHMSDQCFFQDLAADYQVPDKALVVIEKPDIIAQEFSSSKQIELNKNGITAIEFTQGIPIIFNGTEEYKATSVSASKEVVNSKIIYGGYYHPKGSILLRNIFQELSKEAKTFFADDETVTLERVKEFFKVFGVMVPTEVVIGGELTRSEEIKQETVKSGDTTDKGGKLKLLGLVQTWLFSIGYAGETKKDSKLSDDKINQQIRFEANGGDEKYITDVTKWINSLNNPETWKVIRTTGWKYTYEYLHPNIASQFQAIMIQNQKKRKSTINGDYKEATDLLTYQLSSNIPLSNKAPYSLCAHENRLYAFFPHAIHVLSLPDFQTNFKVPSPWKYLKSVVSLNGSLYASTCEGLIKIDPQTLKTSQIKLNLPKDLPMCLLIAYGDSLYAFVDKVIKINPESGECVDMTSTTGWGSASCGYIKDRRLYAVLSGYGNIWSLDLESKAEKKIAGSWGSSQAMFPNPENESQALIYCKQLYKMDLSSGKYEKVEDHKYPDNLCGTIASDNIMYVATKPDYQNKILEKINLYLVKPNGYREPLGVEWDSNSLKIEDKEDCVVVTRL